MQSYRIGRGKPPGKASRSAGRDEVSVISSFPTSACIIDDDADFVNFLSQYLEARGCRTKGFGAGEDLLAGSAIPNFEFFIIDLMLPGIDGVDLISLIRAQSSAGILVISGRMGPDSFNSVLAAGADMFINKPVRFDQVYHAMASINRRLGAARPASIQWQFDQFEQRLLAPNGKQVTVTPLESQILCALQNSGEAPLERATLTALVGISPGPDHRNLDAAVFRLRRKIEREVGLPSPIRTVHGVGYQLGESFANTNNSDIPLT